MGALTAGALARVASPDRTPPTFAGLKSATTCIPGPIDGQTASYHLSWDPATDDVTPSTKIVYEIYQATKPGGEDFFSATYTTRRGAASFTSPPLPADELFYFVVRARDRAGQPRRQSGRAPRCEPLPLRRPARPDGVHLPGAAAAAPPSRASGR